MTFLDCHVIHHVLSNAADGKGITLPRRMVKQLAAEIAFLQEEVDMAVTIPRRIMTLQELHKMQAIRRSLALEMSRWPESIAAGIRVFRAAGWLWDYEKSTPVLRICDTPWRITEQMWQQDREELGLAEEPARGDDLETPAEDNDPAVPQRYFGQLINLITAVIDKPLTSWQRKQLDRWEEAINRNPPTFDCVLKVGVTKEMQEMRHQIERIQAECNTTRNGARALYDRGVRIIEQE